MRRALEARIVGEQLQLIEAFRDSVSQRDAVTIVYHARMRLDRLCLAAGLIAASIAIGPAPMTSASSARSLADMSASAEPSANDLALDGGPWTLAGNGIGRVDHEADGTSIQFRGEFPVAAQVEVTSGGDVNGQWVVGGGATLTLAAGGGTVNSTAEVTTAGEGLVGGTNRELVLVGPVTIAGTAVASVAGREQSVPISETIPAEMRWRVLGEACNQVWGEWVFSGDLNLQGSGVVIEAEGVWTGSRDVSEIREDVQAIFDSIFDGSGAGGDSRLRLMRESAGLIRSYNDMIDLFPNWNVDQVIALAEEAEALLAAFDSLSECDRETLGEDAVEAYKNGLTFAMQGFLIGFGRLGGVPDSESFVHLTHLGARSGAFGAGAANPAKAVEAEEAMRLAGQRILDANVDPADGLVFVNDDTTRAVATGAAMGWSYNFGGGLLPAADIWAATFGSPPPDAGGDSGGGDG